MFNINEEADLASRTQIPLLVRSNRTTSDLISIVMRLTIHGSYMKPLILGTRSIVNILITIAVLLK
jgi:hypothetical protein